MLREEVFKQFGDEEASALEIETEVEVEVDLLCCLGG